MNAPPTLTRKDFISDQDVRWCPGCGDYAILAAIQKTMPELGIPKEKIVFISGIGCSSRFPYYMNTYGFHTIHGRAPTIAAGLRLSNPDLSTWVITGDGDALSIGGNHLIHAMRRNLNINILLFNNEIYGLTKGQYSPTSKPGQRTKSSPYGVIESPFQPLQLALGAGATFVARTTDTNPAHMTEIFKAASLHKGCSFIEILQNCVIFNDGAFDETTARDNRSEQMLHLEPGQPLVYGQNRHKAILLNGLTAEQTSDLTDPRILVHNPALEPIHYANLLADPGFPGAPVVFGILRQVARPVYEDALHQEQQARQAKVGVGNLQDLLYSADTWEVN
ncbi:MAG: 2-oxoacid:ferredoxin oxidoreductase subunit beta [Leptospiraceae bacterium]|nr:2-oxoacid:ferredoxin oxidoreductase subunit beta [Leptospiraceae bacterium]